MNNVLKTLGKLGKADACKQAGSFRIVTSAHRHLNCAARFLLQKLVEKSPAKEYAKASLYYVTV